MIEKTQAECLSGCMDTKICFEAERIDGWDGRLDGVEWGTRFSSLIFDSSSAFCDDCVDCVNAVACALDLCVEDRLH